MSSESRAIARRIVADVFDHAPSPRTSAAAAAGEGDADLALPRAGVDASVEATDVTARIVAEVLAARAEQPPAHPPDADGPPPPPATAVMRDERAEPSAEDEWTRLIAPDRRRRTGRWLLAFVVAVLGLAVLVPLAIVALQQLLTAS